MALQLDSRNLFNQQAYKLGLQHVDNLIKLLHASMLLFDYSVKTPNIETSLSICLLFFFYSFFNADHTWIIACFKFNICSTIIKLYQQTQSRPKHASPVKS